MNTIKSFHIALVILVLSVLAGCSDQLTSSGDESVKYFDKERGSEYEEQKAIPSFHVQLRLKPSKYYTFNYENTGLSEFNSIDVRNLSDMTAGAINNECKDILVFTNGFREKKAIVKLGCHNSKLELKEISVQNNSKSFVDLEIVLTGKIAIKFPVEE